MKGGRARLVAASILFVLVFVAHGWYSMYGAVEEASSRWVELAPAGFSDRLHGYFTGGGLWLGYSYALAGAFALWTALDWLGRRESGVKAVGGFSLSGAVAGAACFMTGCCGSPMLGVWVGLLGASAAPYLGPFAALVSTLSLFAAARLMRRGKSGACGSDKCNC